MTTLSLRATALAALATILGGAPPARAALTAAPADLAARGFAAAPARGEPAARATKNPRLLKAIALWLDAYRKGELPVVPSRPLGKKSLARRLGVLPKDFSGELNAERELGALLGEAAKLETPEAALAILRVAAVGLDDFAYTPAMAPHLVRSVAEAVLRQQTAAAVRDAVQQVAAASGRKAGKGGAAAALQAAALRALGDWGEASRGTLESQLQNEEARVRLGAAEGLRRLASVQAAPALIELVGREADGAVLEVAVAALRETFAAHPEAVTDGALRAAVGAVVAALGRGGWRADIALVGFLERYRSVEAIPALIDVLQRFVDRRDEIGSGTLSGLLRYHTHEALRALTGAAFPADAPGEWRSFWESVRADFKLPDVVRAEPGAAAEAAVDGSPHTVVQARFCGLPIRGTQVTFVVDLSGSMAFDMPPGSMGLDAGQGVPSRLDFAKRELIRAAEGLPETAKFNLVTFNGNPRAKTWMPQPVLATPALKKRFRQFVEEMRADGGTNTWEGMRVGLATEKLALRDGPSDTIDELFLLSDGLPSVGEVFEAEEILHLVRETNEFAKVRINTVCILGELTGRDEETQRRAGMPADEFMKRMAAENGGTAIKL